MDKKTAERKAGLAAAGERLGLIGSLSKKLVNINERGTKAKFIGAPKNQIKKHRETREEYLARMMAVYKVKPLRVRPLPDYDVTNPTRYQEVEMWDAGTIAQENILKRYNYVMKEQVITPYDFRLWRESYMLMSTEQLASVIRVTELTVQRWESGLDEIPFSMWWMMHTTLQDPAYFLSRPGFHDFYIEYENGEALLCSHKSREIRYSPTDLYFNRAVFNELLVERSKLERANEAYEKLQAENTELREMYKTNSLSKELESMHAYIGQLVARISTADIVPFQIPERADPVKKFRFKAS